MSIVVEQADIKRDGAIIIDLLDTYARDSYGGGESLSDFAKTNLIDNILNRPYIQAFIAYDIKEDSKTPAGLAIVIEGFSTFACKSLLNIHDFSVSPDFRGRGVGKLLMAKVLEYAKSIDCCKVTLEVLSGNLPAKGLYSVVGFTPYQLDPNMGNAEFWHYYL